MRVRSQRPLRAGVNLIPAAPVGVICALAVEAETLGFHCEVADNAYGRLGDQVDAGSESPFRHTGNLLPDPRPLGGELVDGSLWFPPGNFCN